MDCRRSMVVALTLTLGVSGCFLRDKPSPQLTADTTADVRPQRDLPKRQPKANTCLAYGNHCEQESRNEKASPAEQERLREQARKAYQQALKIEPKNLKAAQALARHYVACGDHERAVATYQKALKVHPKDVSLWSDLGMCHARHKEWDPAIRTFEKAVALDPENRPIAHQYGFCLARAGRYEDSLACFKKTDGEAKAHYNLARMLNHMQQNDLSRVHLQLALEKDPYLIDAKQLLVQLDSKGPAPRTFVPVHHEEPNE